MNRIIITTEQRNAILKNYQNDFMGQWIEYADQHHTDFMFRFIAYWVAFTNLLERRYYRLKKERDRIDKFCADAYYLSDLRKFDPFTVQGLMDEILKEPIQDKYVPREEEYKALNKYGSLSDSKITEKDADDRRAALFKTMYTIRCNLVHGRKEVSVERDRTLVEKSADIMEGYLKSIHKNT